MTDLTGRSERIGNDVCGLSRRWILDPTLAGMFASLALWAQSTSDLEGLRWPGLFIISGWRSEGLQLRINPTKPDSTHTQCPSKAGDLRVGDVPASLTPEPVWRWLGEMWQAMGGRWGGTFLEGFAGGGTPDLNHFELPA